MRHDVLLRVVMWIDAFLSVTFVGVAVVVTPIVASVPAPHAVLVVLGYVTLASAVVLAACGAVTAVAISLRMRAGEYWLPRALRLPLPDGMRPAPATFDRRPSRQRPE